MIGRMMRRVTKRMHLRRAQPIRNISQVGRDFSRGPLIKYESNVPAVSIVPLWGIVVDSIRPASCGTFCARQLFFVAQFRTEHAVIEPGFAGPGTRTNSAGGASSRRQEQKLKIKLLRMPTKGLRPGPSRYFQRPAFLCPAELPDAGEHGEIAAFDD